jgi:hypothetical protein
MDGGLKRSSASDIAHLSAIALPVTAVVRRAESRDGGDGMLQSNVPKI